MARSVRGILSGVEDGFLQGLRAAARQGEISSALDLPAATLLSLASVRG